MSNVVVTYDELNETEIRFAYKVNSSREDFVAIKTDMLVSGSSNDDNAIKSSSIENKAEKRDNILESVWVSYKAKREQEKLNSLIRSLTEELVIELRFFSLDDNEFTSAERKILNVEEQYGFRVLGEVLQNIYLSCNDYPNMLAGICKGLGRFDLQEVRPWGPTMLAGLLNHKSEVVKEYAVALVENWSDASLLPFLRNIETKSSWLEAYISDVVSYLEEYDVLHKKVI